MPLEYWRPSTISLPSIWITQITLAALALHNHLREHAPDTYIPQALTDREDREHHIIPGGLRNDAPLLSVPAS